MELITSFVIMLVGFLPIVSGTNRAILDVQSDATFSWRIRGNYFYTPSGSQLQDFQDHLPQNFSFQTIANAKGVWTIFPSLSPIATHENYTDYTNKVSFSFSASAQLLESVTIRHNSGGHPKINIIGTYVNFTETPETMYEYWADVTYPLKGGNRFTIEAIASNARDYIFIDRIEATFVETTTSPRPPRSSTTTTKKPQPLNAGSVLTMHFTPLHFLLYIVAMVIMI